MMVRIIGRVFGIRVPRRFMVLQVLVVLLMAVFVMSTTDARAATQQAKLTASDAAAGDTFGYSVSISGDTALVGAPTDDDGGADSGSTYVFVRNGTTWTQQAKLTASDAATGDEFGTSVSLDGDTALVGAKRDNAKGVFSGSAYVFVRSGTTWTQQTKLIADDGGAGDKFGFSVSIDGDTALVGALFGHGNVPSSGSAYVFFRNGTTWTQQAKLSDPDGAALDLFGQSVSVSGDTALIGAPSDDDNGNMNSGSSYVYTRSGTSWTQQAKLIADDAKAGDNLGHSVSLDGDTALIGAKGNDDKGASSGSAYVFTRSGTTWSQQAKLIADDGAGFDLFGLSVSIDGDKALVGAISGDGNVTDSGSAYAFVRSGTTWTQQDEWGRMAIVDTKPFKLRVILHRIFVERPQVTGIPAWPGGAACYRRSRYIL